MEKIKINEWQLYNLACALDRLKMLDIKPVLRYAVARNSQIVKPLMSATLEAFPEPKELPQRETWAKTLESREVELCPYFLVFIPEFDDQVLAQELRTGGEVSEENIAYRRSVQNQAIMEALMPIIREAVIAS